ncbi:MAG: hypothetical protein RBR74_07260 [Ignavibacteriaceae bacterium]|jgi:hypothetical protein|nr:hypothetical protein [Ignavibacteriaceae bacterium]
MASNKKLSEVQTLENYRVALTNAVSQPEVAATMAEFGYSAEEIAKGNKLLAQTTTAYESNKTEDNETVAARAVLDEKIEKVSDQYSLDRKKGKVVYRNDEVMLKKLGLTGSIPQSYAKLIATMKTFYNGVDSDTAAQEKLARLKITPKEIKASIAAIKDLENSRAEYLKEVGESQDATKAKDDAFAKIDDWMSEFFAVAKIAMEDNPQLLESLGVLVRSKLTQLQAHW